jgi:hypothetical protein
VNVERFFEAMTIRCNCAEWTELQRRLNLA